MSRRIGESCSSWAGSTNAAGFAAPALAQDRSVGRLVDAVWLHSDRFDRAKALSLVTLLTPSRRVTKPNAVATLTVIPTARQLAVLSLGWIAATTVTGVSAGFAVVAPWLTPLVLVALWVVALLSSALERRLRGRWCWRHDVGEWVLADVAAVRGSGGGDQIMRDITADADAQQRTLLLRVDADNRAAVNLYSRHGFTPQLMLAGSVKMIRHPHAAVPAAVARTGDASRKRSGSGRTLAVSAPVAAVAVWLCWGTPAVWLVPLAVGLAALATVYDLRERRVPNVLTAAGLALIAGTLVSVWVATGDFLISPAAVGLGIFAGPLLITHVVTANQYPGLGDVKLAGLFGAITGAIHPTASYTALIAAMVLGIIFGLIWRQATGQRTFPLAPVLSATTVIVLLAWPLSNLPTNW